MRKFFNSIIISICLLIPLPIFAIDEVYIGGDSVGIELMYDGVIVVGIYSFDVDNKQYHPTDIIRVGDRITHIENHKIESIQDFLQYLKKYPKKTQTRLLTVIRANKSLTIPLQIVYDQNISSFKTGLYIKDCIHGIGTMTFYNENNHRFAALGHEINDDGDIKVVQNGTLYDAFIHSFTRSISGLAGQKNGSINNGTIIGKIDKNTPYGIFGRYDVLPSHTSKIKVASSDEIQLGRAEFMTVLKGNTIKNFQIEITKIHPKSQGLVKNFEYVVTDQELLQSTGGIIQGMSGSPILQNGKIVGAVTHVLVNDPTRGYGIFIENMLEQ